MNPYKKLGNNAFWKLAVADRDPLAIEELWSPKFLISKDDKVSTYGSCFAQHISNSLKSRGYNWVSTELSPDGMSISSAKTFSYNIFSSRTGNIYTSSLLRQWVGWACGAIKPPEEVWLYGERFMDPFRPRVEPNGFYSIDELKISQKHTIDCFRKSIETSDIFVFTMGLTESWFNRKFGYEYPMCPGTIGGVFNADDHEFRNQGFHDVLNNLSQAISMMMELNGRLKFILTVSPVPLTATNSGKHVLVATMLSKSILRAVAGEMAKNSPMVDYFPSYEIVNNPAFHSRLFEKNLRSVSSEGVEFVMDSFFKCMQASDMDISDRSKNISNIHIPPNYQEELHSNSEGQGEDLLCEEEFLSAFSPLSA